MENLSGLKPLGRAVLVKTYEPEVKRGMIEIPDIVRERTQMIEQRAVVVEIGESAWADEQVQEPFFFGLFRRWVRRPRARVGDRVLVTKFAGFMAKGADGEQYRLVNDRDLFCQITDEKAVQLFKEAA